MKALVTGGCGFIGSHVVEALLIAGHDVVVLDNLITGKTGFLPQYDRLAVRIGDCLDLNAVKHAMSKCDAVFHFQANADVRHGIDSRRVDLEQNVHTTWNVLEAMKIVGCNHIVFPSSAVVYGEPSVFPTPETYTGTQTSLYGASKFCCESMIQAYSNYFGFRHHIFRFVSWIGKRYSHGVIFDFVRNLNGNPAELRVLGDGRQEKSYLHVSDGVEGVMLSINGLPQGIYNLGHDESRLVSEVAGAVIAEMGLKPNVVYGTEPRGWVGDSPVVRLDTTRIKAHGWTPVTSIIDGVRDTVRYLVKHPELLRRP